MHDESGFPIPEKNGIALIGVPEYRRFTETNKEHDSFRSQFYQLNRGDGWNFSICDLGNIKQGHTVEDTYFALQQVLNELIRNDVIPLVIGGGQDLLFPCYKAFELLERTINICTVDHQLDIGEPETEIKYNAYVSHLLLQRPCYLFNYANIGAQWPLVKKEELELFEKLYFDSCRLGEFNMDFKRAEPHLRNSDLIGIDFNSIKAQETDPRFYDQVNGFKSDQICQIAKYAGISDKLSCFGVFNIIPDHNKMASALLAQVIWYFIDGVAQRVGDFPVGSKKNYTKFHVTMESFDEDLVFYKSNKSGRWWLEITYPAGEGGKYERHHMVPCNYEDYQLAMEDTIPDLWWKTLQKLT